MNDSATDNAGDHGAVLRVRAAVAAVHARADITSEMTSQYLAGFTVQSLATDADWHHVRGEDGYAGWMHRGYLEPCTGDETDWPITTGGVVQEADGRVRALPFGARVAPDAIMRTGDALDADDRLLRFPRDGAAIVQSVVASFSGASYLWGGVTPWGTDCSGMVQAVCAMHSVLLPRDAHEQAHAGQAVAMDTLAESALAAGDLLFFSSRADQHITHVGIADGAGRLIHSALGRAGVVIDALHESSEYIARLRSQWVSVRRVV